MRGLISFLLERSFPRLRVSLVACIVVAVVIVVASCAAAFGSVPDRGRLSAGVGVLRVTVVGLPRAQAADVTLSGPNGFSRRAAAGFVVFRARAGQYRLTVRSVRIGRNQGSIRSGAIASPVRRVLVVRVRAGSRVRVAANYASIVNPGVRSLGGGVLSVAGPPGDPTAVVLRGRVVFAPRAIISMPASGMLPRGLLSHVVGASYRGGDTTVALVAASIYEVAPSFQFDVPLTVSQASAAAFSAGCGLASAGVAPYRRIEHPSFSGGWNAVSLFGHNVPIGVRAAVHFTAAAGVQAKASLGVGCSAKASVSANGMAGPIPVTAAIQGELTAFAGLGGTFEAGGAVHIDAGASTIGTPPLLVWKPELSFSQPGFTLTEQTFAAATAGIGMAASRDRQRQPRQRDAESRVKRGLLRPARRINWEARFGQFSAEAHLLGWDIETPKTPPFFTKQLWHNPCGASTGGGGGGGGGGAGGSVGGSGGGTTGSGEEGEVAAHERAPSPLARCTRVGC